MPEKILLVEDETDIAELLQLYLVGEGYQTFLAENGVQAKEFINGQTFDLAIVDLMLPDIDGFELCGLIREKHTYPILILTAKDNQIDKITGFSLGADDYITKPFKPLEVIARIKANLRRYKDYNLSAVKELPQDIILLADIQLNFNHHDAYIDGKKLELTPKEFGILSLLVKKKGEALSTEKIFLEVWGEKYYEMANNTVMVHVRHLRQKMGKEKNDRGYIQTVWGVGYMIDD